MSNVDVVLSLSLFLSLSIFLLIQNNNVGTHEQKTIDTNSSGFGGCPSWGCYFLLLTWRCFASEGPRLLSFVGAFALVLNSFFGVGLFWPPVSKKKDTNSSSIDMWQMFEKERERNHLYCIKESPLQYSRNIQESSCKRDREWHRVGKPEFSSSLQGHQANPDKGALILTPPPTPKLNIQGSCGIFDFRI